MALAWNDRSMDGQASVEKIDLSSMIRRINRYMVTNSYEEALKWIEHYVKVNLHSGDWESKDTLLNIKIQIILIQAEHRVRIEPEKTLKDCQLAYQNYELLHKKEKDYNEKINYILKILYEQQVQEQNFRKLYQLLCDAYDSDSNVKDLSGFSQCNYLAHKLEEGVGCAEEIERIWSHNWKRKLHILKDLREQYFYSKDDLEQAGSIDHHKKSKFYFSPDLYSTEHPHRELDLLFYNNDFFVARDLIVQDVLGTKRMMNRKVYGKSKVKLNQIRK